MHPPARSGPAARRRASIQHHGLPLAQMHAAPFSSNASCG